MELRELGSLGFNVSLLGLGTVKFGRNQGVKYPHGFELPDDDQVVSLLSQARELGINFLDTAPAYGAAEERLGQLLPEPNAWVIATKVGEIFENGVSRFDFSATAIEASLDRSLKRLRREVLEIVFIHSDGNDLDILDNSDAVDILRGRKQLGDIAAIGMSSKTVEGGLRALELCDVVMVELNPDDGSQLPVIAHARERGKGVVIKKALSSGHTTDPAAALRQAADTPGVHSIIVGTLNPTHLAANCAAVGM